jgi:hypothetical protein
MLIADKKESPVLGRFGGGGGDRAAAVVAGVIPDYGLRCFWTVR